MKTAAIKLTSPAAIRAACELSIAQGEQHAQVMYKSDDFEDDDYVGADLEEFASVKDDAEEFEEYCGAGRHSWELWVTERFDATDGSPSPSQRLFGALVGLLNAIGGLPVTILNGPMYDALREAELVVKEAAGELLPESEVV